MPRAANGLLELLVEHGVPDRAARIYLVACREGPQSASELARRAAVPRVDAYRLVRTLEREGLLTASGRRPMRFVAVPPSEVVDRFIHRATEHLRRLETDRGRLLTDWQQEIAFGEPDGPRKFLVLEGRPAIQAFLKRRFGVAEREILLSVSGFSLATAVDGGLDRALKEAQGRGVRIRMVTEISAANLGDAKHFASFVELRHATAPVTNRAIAVDRAGALVFVSGEEGLGASGENQVALWSSAPEFLGLVRQYHQRTWSRGSAAAARIVELESPPTAVLPVRRGPDPAPFQRLAEIAEIGMRATGIPQVDLDLPELIEAIARQLGRQVAEGVDGRTAPEVARSLVRYYGSHARARLEVARSDPLVLRVTNCHACLPQSPEIGRVLCPKLFQTVLERRLGGSWSVSRPDPTRHAARGCLFNVTAA